MGNKQVQIVIKDLNDLEKMQLVTIIKLLAENKESIGTTLHQLVNQEKSA